MAVILLILKKSSKPTEPVNQFQVLYWAQQKGPRSQNVSTAGVEELSAPEASHTACPTPPTPPKKKEKKKRIEQQNKAKA